MTETENERRLLQRANLAAEEAQTWHARYQHALQQLAEKNEELEKARQALETMRLNQANLVRERVKRALFEHERQQRPSTLKELTSHVNLRESQEIQWERP